MTKTLKQDLVILGGGAGGLVVASGAAQLGLKVTLIEKAKVLGGDCLHSGCVPSKTLIHAAKVAHWIKNADQVGLSAQTPQVDLRKVNQHISEIIAKIQEHDSVERFKALGVNVLFGEPQFLTPHTVCTNGQTVRAKRFVIATGGSPIIPSIEGLEDVDFHTNETIFKATSLPKHLMILGGGAIGLELAQAFVRLGAKVSVIEQGNKLLAHEESEASEILQKILAKEGIEFHFNTQINKVESDADTKTLIAKQNGNELLKLQGDALLIAIGRKPNVHHLGLEHAGVLYSHQGITVDQLMRTNQRHIYAVGDVVASPYKLTHMAEYEAGLVLGHVGFRVPRKFKDTVIPMVTFTDPELARVGLTQKQAIEKGYKKVEILSVPLSSIDRAVIESQPEGVAKFIVHKQKILGATILGPHAGELIAEVALAMQAGLSIGKISGTIHAYPTLAQLNRAVVNTHYAKKLFNSWVRGLVWVINRLF